MIYEGRVCEWGTAKRDGIRGEESGMRVWGGSREDATGSGVPLYEGWRFDFNGAHANPSDETRIMRYGVLPIFLSAYST